MCPTGNDETDDPLGEVALGWALAVGGVALAFRLLPEGAARVAAVAVWIAVPVALHRRAGRSLAEAGLLPRAPGRAIGALAVYVAAFLPAFALAYWAWRRVVEGDPTPFRPAGTGVFFASLGWTLLTAALPEEAFFRGFVQPRLGARLGGGAWRGVPLIPITRAVVAAAALFAVTHVVFEYDLPSVVTLGAAARLATFFPGLLFGALREETGDIIAPALFHALCNATLFWMQAGYEAG